jgi:hypothetical protein
MKREDSPQREQQRPERPKKPYVTPSLNVLGTLERVTLDDFDQDGSPQ